jgi:signal-transduction protein with cAMP-binding, CBS, and nucleotidyltransferase domain
MSVTTIGHLMNKDIQKIDHQVAVQEAASKMKEKRVGSLLVEKGEQYVGIITETDIVRKAVARGLDLKKETVGSLMSSPVITLDQQRSPRDAHDLMGESGVRHLGVTQNGKIVGVVSVRDILVFFKGQSEPKMGID